MTSVNIVSTVEPGAEELDVLTDSGKLSKDLDESSEHKTLPPLRDLEHNGPTLGSHSLLGGDVCSDLSVFLIDPVLVVAVKVQLLKHDPGLLVTVLLDEPSGGFWQDGETGD